MRVPAVSPFTSMGDYRVEFRIHDWAPVESIQTIISWGWFPNRYVAIRLTPLGELCASDDVDAMPMGETTCANVNGHKDLLVRVQRFATLSVYKAPGLFLMEVWGMDGTPITAYCGINGSNTSATAGCPIGEARTIDWSRQMGFIGNPWEVAPFSLGWLKWHSATVPPGGPPPSETAAADLADWRFEGNLENQGTSGYNVALEAFRTGAAYATSRLYAPLCAAGVSRTYRAGFPAQLDGSGSQALNGDGDLSYFWQQLSGPTQVQWAFGRETARPWIRGTVFGTYVFQLTVTDSGGQSRSCTVKHGFVATNGNDVVITNNAATDLLLGPLIRFGANPWPWADDRHKAMADTQAALLDTHYPAWWEIQARGTIAFTAGSKTITGVGTSFTTDFCQGPDNPTAPKPEAQINVWYPNSSPQGYGVRMQGVESCQSDTQLTLSAAWNNDVADCPSGGCRYALWGNDGVWAYSAAPANYYDAVAAFYALYYRTGIDDYLIAARKLADRHWVHQLDSGTVCTAGKCGGGRYSPRSIALLGMVLRAMDGRPDMWDGLHKMIAFFRDNYLTGYALNIAWGLWDVREMAYHQMMVAYGALYSPDPAFRAACKNALTNVMDKLWNVTKAPDGSWQQRFAQHYSWTTPPSTATVKKGSTTVTGNGTAWTSAVDGGRLVFHRGTGSEGRPRSRAEQEDVYYTVKWVNATTLILDRPYEGNTGTYGWMIGTSQAVGWGVQPFIEGILGVAFEFTAQALADSDPANATRAHEHNVSIANWLRTVGYRPANKGMQYFAGTVDCMPPIPESKTWCTANNDASQARTLNAEALRSVMLAYQYTGDAELLAFGDTLYNAMYAKIGTCPSGSALCVPDGDYIADLNVNGWYMTGTPPIGRAHKWFGMFYGIGAGASWPGYRVGGTGASSHRKVQVGVNTQGVPGATAARIVAKSPSGGTVQVLCAASPCTVDLDERQGDHLFQLEYLSASGTVLASTKLDLLHGK